MGKQIELPDYVINKALVKSKIEEAKQMVETANVHFKNLQAEQIPTDLKTLQIILKSDEAFKDWTSKAEKSYIGKLGFIPIEERKRIHQTFSDLIDRTASSRNVLQGFLYNRYGWEVLEDENGCLTLDFEKIAAEANEQAKKYFSEEDKEYFKLLQNTHLAFKKLADYEAKQKYVAFSNNHLFFQMLCRNEYSVPVYANLWSNQIGKMNPAALEMLEDDE